MESSAVEQGLTELRNRRMRQTEALLPAVKGGMMSFSATPLFPSDVWHLIAKKLSFRDLLNLRKSWAWLYHHPQVAAEFVKAWCLALPEEFAGEIKEEMGQLLNYCFETTGSFNFNKAIDILSRLNGLPPVDVTTNPLDGWVAKILSNQTEEGEKARRILKSTLQAIITTPDKVNISPQAFIAREERFKYILSKMPMVGLGIMVGGVLWQGVNTINVIRGVTPYGGPMGQHLQRTIIMAGAGIAAFPYAKQSRLFDRCRNAGFWRKVQRLQDREENQSRQLEALADSTRFRASSLFNIGVLMSSFAVILFLIYIITQINMANADNFSPRARLGNNSLG